MAPRVNAFRLARHRERHQPPARLETDFVAAVPASARVRVPLDRDDLTEAPQQLRDPVSNTRIRLRKAAVATGGYAAVRVHQSTKQLHALIDARAKIHGRNVFVHRQPARAQTRAEGRYRTDRL